MSTIIRGSFRVLTLLLLVGLFLNGSTTIAAEYRIAQPPTWVKPISPPSQENIPHNNTSNGVAYILVDNQWNVTENDQEYYAHYISKSLNTSGVDNISQITISFDPAYESVILHSIVLHRNGSTLDRINRARLDVIQRERDLENQIYDGAKTLNIFLEDIRVGDTVEYSYSIQGMNPVFSDHFTARLKMQWGVPVEHLHYRLLWPHSRPLDIKNHQTVINAVITDHTDHIEYVWRNEQIPPLIADDNLPGWFNPYPVIQLSDFSNWQEVIEWAKPLYGEYTPSTAQQDILDTLLTESDSIEERILAILRFVQDDIRYLGIELGIRSHKPNHPDLVLRQRFGDCKDKSRLLVSLLRIAGAHADVALVNTYSGKRLNDNLPTPKAFNHVIVRVSVDGQKYWLDPTLNYQRGTLRTLYRPDYGYALIISEQNTQLTLMADYIDAVHSKTVIEDFDISEEESSGASYHITTNYFNYYADSIRSDISRSNIGELQKSYLNYTASSYPDVRVADEMRVTDIEKENRMELTEDYIIPKIWKKYDDRRYVYASFSPFLIHDHLSPVTSLKRTMPYAVSHPVLFTHTTRIKVEEGADFPDEHIAIKDKAFIFTKNVTFKANNLIIQYSYESIKDHVLPEDIQSYSENIDKVLELADYQAQKPDPAIISTNFWNDLSDINWLTVTIFFIALLVSIVLSWKFIYRYDPPYSLPADVDTSLAGLRGWLILPGIALVIAPFRILYNSKDLLDTFSATQWSFFQDSFGNLMLVLLSSEIIVNVALVVVTIFLINLFFKRRNTFPRFFVLYLIAGLVILIADSILTDLLINKGQKIDESITQIVRQSIYTCIWVSYFLKSRRVKATFTRGYTT